MIYLKAQGDTIAWNEITQHAPKKKLRGTSASDGSHCLRLQIRSHLILKSIHLVGKLHRKRTQTLKTNEFFKAFICKNHKNCGLSSLMYPLRTRDARAWLQISYRTQHVTDLQDYLLDLVITDKLWWTVAELRAVHPQSCCGWIKQLAKSCATSKEF